MSTKLVKLFLRLAIAASFLSAVADRLGMWGKEVSVWGNWDNFLTYTKLINPWFPDAVIPGIGMFATAAEVIFAVFLIIGFKTELFAKLSGVLLVMFGLSMCFSTGVKGPLDYSVWSAAAAAFSLSLIKEKFLEIDVFTANKK